MPKKIELELKHKNARYGNYRKTRVQYLHKVILTKNERIFPTIPTGIKTAKYVSLKPFPENK